VGCEKEFIGGELKATQEEKKAESKALTVGWAGVHSGGKISRNNNKGGSRWARWGGTASIVKLRLREAFARVL